MNCPDEQITSPDTETITFIKKVLSNNKDIDNSSIEVSYDSGTVRLQGLANNFWQVHKAEELVSALRGVIVVKNELNVVHTKKFADKNIAKVINAHFKRTYMLEGNEVLIEVKDGVVTLTGTVKSEAAKKFAFEAAANISGVVNAINNINVVLR